MAKAIHMMIRVLEEERSVDFYQRAFGLKVADRYGFDSFTLVYLSNEEAPFEVELTIVIGKPAKNVSEEEALDYVLAYTGGNDVRLVLVATSIILWLRF